MADANRSIYYLVKSNLTTFLRYNGFLILYPVGIIGEMLLIQNYVDRNKHVLSDQEVLGIRVVQVLILIGFVYIFMYMLKNRKKALKRHPVAHIPEE